MNLKKFLLLILCLCFNLAHAELVVGTDYQLREQIIPQENPDKVEVLEFFSYVCVHCYHLEPVLSKHVKTFANDTYFKQSHVVWNHEMFDLATINAAAILSNSANEINPALFQAIFEENKEIFDVPAFITWAENQKNLNTKPILNALKNPLTLAKAKQMNSDTKKYKISATPMIIVGGKYELLNRDMGKLDELIDKVRQEKGMTKTSTKTKPKALGASFASDAK